MERSIGFNIKKLVRPEPVGGQAEPPKPRDYHGRFIGRTKSLSPKWDFVISPRFWAMVGLAITVGLQQDGLIHGGLATALLTIFGGFFGVKSYEKYISPKE